MQTRTGPQPSSQELLVLAPAVVPALVEHRQAHHVEADVDGRTCSTSSSQREVIQAHGQTGSNHMSTVARSVTPCSLRVEPPGMRHTKDLYPDDPVRASEMRRVTWATRAAAGMKDSADGRGDGPTASAATAAVEIGWRCTWPECAT